MVKRMLLGVLLASAVAGCATQHGLARDGKEYGVTKGTFRGRWWSYYERGSSYLGGEFYAEAEADFRQALVGRKSDTWQARTYGLHFTDYFPNRELGVCCYHQDRLDDAEQYLKKSLEQIDTARAHHYLDLVAKARIAKGEIKDDTAPSVTASIGEATIVATREVPVEVEVTDDVGVEQVVVNDKPIPQRGSAEKVEVKETVLLTEGTHEIKIEAGDLAEKAVTQTVKVEVDLTGPTVGIFAPIDPTVTEAALTRLEGTSVDKNGVASVALGDRIVVESKGDKRVEFASDLPLGSGENAFIVVAKDIAGNETRCAVKVFQGKPGSMAARWWLIKQRAPHLLELAQSRGLGVLPYVLTGAEELPEATAPELRINLKSPKPEQPYRHNKTMTISGEAISDAKITALSINGEPFQDLTGAPKESFNRRIPIDVPEGEEVKVAVAIQATDEQGRKSEQQFQVPVRPVLLDSSESKMPVAVLAFAGSGVEPSVADYLRSTAESKLFDMNRFRILDRTRLQDVLNEQELAAALADPNEAIRLGKVTNAYVFLVGEVFPRDEKGIEVKAKAIDAETSEVLSILDVFIDDKDDSAKVAAGCTGLADQLVKMFPRLSGELVLVKPAAGGAEVYVDWTKEDGIREGMYVLVVHEEQLVDEDTGEVLDSETVILGRGKIDKLLNNMVKAKAITQEGQDVTYDKGMPAVTM